MTTERDRDPLARLRALNPVPATQFEGAALSAAGQALFERIVAVDRRPPVGSRPPRRLPEPVRRRVPRLVVAAVAVVLSVGVAGYALVGRQPSKVQAVACFATADLRADTSVVDVDRRGPVAACADLWAAGAFGADPAPPLRACTLESGVVGVFPEPSGRDVCLELGLVAVSSPSTTPGGSRPPTEGVPAGDEMALFLGFRDAVLDRFVGQDCVAAGPAEAIVREELQRAGLGGWTVTVGLGEGGAGFSADRPCASLSFLPDQRAVVLVPLPLRPADPSSAGGG